MATLLLLVTGFGYFIAGAMATALVAWRYQDQIVVLLDATIPWPSDDSELLDAMRDEVEDARYRTYLAFAEIEVLEALSSLPLHLPVWEMPEPEAYPHGIALAIIRSHPGGSGPGYVAAYQRWVSIHARE